MKSISEQNSGNILFKKLNKLALGVCLMFISFGIIGYFLGQINEATDDIERKQYNSVATELGVSEKEVILTEKFWKPNTYKVETSKGIYNVQFDDNYQVQRIVKEK